MIGALLSDLWPYLAAAAGAVAAIGMAWFSGKRAGKSDSENKALKASAKKQKDGRNAAENMHGAGRAKWLEQLHKRRD